MGSRGFGIHLRPRSVGGGRRRHYRSYYSRPRVVGGHPPSVCTYFKGREGQDLLRLSSEEGGGGGDEEQ